MKYTLALFLGVISAAEVNVARNKQALMHTVSALKIEISKDGQKKIEKEFNDVKDTMEDIKDSRPVRNLESSLKRWARTKEAMGLKKLDKKFLKSKEGKRLMQEWKDVGDLLKENIKETENGIHFNNDAMDDLSDELDDVSDQYESPEMKKWDKAYEKQWKKALDTDEAHSVERRWNSFERSKEGQRLGKELEEFGQSIDDNVEVSDIPEDWKKTTNMLKIEVSKRGQREIEKEMEDVHQTMEDIKDHKVVRNLKHSIKRWGHSEEVQHIKELDKKFMKSPEGKRLMAEWKDFGEALKKHVHETEDGIHIDNDGLDEIADEADDVEHVHKKIFKKGSKWERRYSHAWEDALTNEEWGSVERRGEDFGKSKEWKRLEKELKDLDKSIHDNVHVSDVPEDWKLTNNLKVTIHNQDDIKDEWEDVEGTWDDIKHSKPVRNLEGSLDRWGHSDEVKDLKKLDNKFKKSPEGKRLVREWKDVFETLDDTVYFNKKGIHIDNKELQQLEDELKDVDDQYKELEGGKWDKAYKKGWEDALTNKEWGSVERRAKSFKKSDEGQRLHKEVHEFKKTLFDNVEVSDIPKRWKKDMYLF